MILLKQFAKDADDIVNTLDNSWWETALDLVPVAGDIYGSAKFIQKIKKVYDRSQDLENNYVKKILEKLPPKQRKQFIENMRRRGVEDARKDQSKGLDVGGVLKYEKNKKIEGHHTESVSKHPEKMTDPRIIEFKTNKDHIKFHQENGVN